MGGHSGNGDDNFFSAFRALPDAEWDYAAPVVFEVDTLRDSISRGGTVIVSLRHTHGYEYSNLWLELSTPINDSTVRRDTLNIRLADTYGRWLGKGMGPSLEVCDTLPHAVDLRRKQNISVRHIMRVDTLEGIEQIGIVFLPKD